jgi:hypothetical protein
LAEQTVVCPKCHARIPLSRALGGQLEDRIRKELASEFRDKEKTLKAEYTEQIEAASRDAERVARKKIAAELKDVQRELTEAEGELDAARKREVGFRKRQRDLDEKQKNLELELQRRLDDQRKRLEESISARLAEESRLRDLEKDKQLGDMRRQIDDLKRKAEQGSQEARGEAAEMALEDILRQAFPHDQIEPISKGARGADLLQKVRGPVGRECGGILWEFKAARAWSDNWATKLRDDQQAAKADIGIIATFALPKGVSHFGFTEGVWVSDVDTIVGAAASLRSGLIELYSAKASEEGKAEKMDVLYHYLSGPEFRQRVEGMADPFISMREDLDRERRAMENSWAKREKQIARVMKHVAGMYGDIQGIVGAALPRIDRLELPEPTPLLDQPEEEIGAA